MAEQTSTTRAGTEVTKRLPDVVPNLKEPCQAIVTSNITICEPMSDGTWRLVTTFNDNYNIILKDRDINNAQREVIAQLVEIKQKWKKEDRIVSLETLLTIERPSSSATEKSESSPAPDAKQT